MQVRAPGYCLVKFLLPSSFTTSISRACLLFFATEPVATMFLAYSSVSLGYQGLFPWAIVALCAIALAKASHSTQEVKLSHSLRDFGLAKLPPAFASVVDITVVLSALLVLLFMLSLALWTILTSIYPALQLWPLLVGVMLCGVTILSPWWQRLSRRLSFGQNHFSLIIILDFALVLIITLLAQTLGFALDIQASVLPNVVLGKAQLYIICWAISLSLTPILACWLIQVGQQHRLLKVLLLLLPGPFLIMLSIPLLPHLTSFNLGKPILIMATAGLNLLLITKSQSLKTTLVYMTANNAGKNMRRMRRLMAQQTIALPIFLAVMTLSPSLGLGLIWQSYAIALLSFCLLPLSIMSLMCS